MSIDDLRDRIIPGQNRMASYVTQQQMNEALIELESRMLNKIRYGGLKAEGDSA